MSLIPEDFLHELINRTDLVELIQTYVPLKKQGVNYTSCCPFHNEKTPSFNVVSKRQFYHCFGCGAHGNAISFMMSSSYIKTKYMLKESGVITYSDNIDNVENTEDDVENNLESPKFIEFSKTLLVSRDSLIPNFEFPGSFFVMDGWQGLHNLSFWGGKEIKFVQS